MEGYDAYKVPYEVLEPKYFRRTLDSIERSMVEDQPEWRAVAGGLAMMMRLARMARKFWECV